VHDVLKSGHAGWPEAVVFDLDGTLIDSAGDIAGALNTALAARGLAPFTVERVKQMIGGGIPKLVERALLAHGVSRDALLPLAHDFIRVYGENLTVETKIFAGGLEVLDRLAAEGRKLGICTNKQHDLTVRLLDELGIADYFGVVVGERIGAPKKPDAAPLLAVLSGLGVAAERAVMVGDSAADVGCAHAAGVPCILLSHGYSTVPAHELGADLVIDRLADLHGALTELALARAVGAYRSTE
jgi:phosphoglycolate phosphatase